MGQFVGQGINMPSSQQSFGANVEWVPPPPPFFFDHILMTIYVTILSVHQGPFSIEHISINRDIWKRFKFTRDT